MKHCIRKEDEKGVSNNMHDDCDVSQEKQPYVNNK